LRQTNKAKTNQAGTTYKEKNVLPDHGMDFLQWYRYDTHLGCGERAKQGHGDRHSDAEPLDSVIL
jgi:hypothetical protein